MIARRRSTPALDPDAARSGARRASTRRCRSRTALAAAVAIIQQRVVDIWRLVSSVGPRFHEHDPAADGRQRRARAAVRGAPRPSSASSRSSRPRAAARAHAVDDPPDARRASRCRPTRSSQLFLHGVAQGRAPMLIRLLRSHLRPYTQAAAARRRAADRADVGRADAADASTPTSSTTACCTGDIGYIWHVGARHARRSRSSRSCSPSAAVYFGAKVAMSFGRDLRNNLFHQVTDFSAREVGTFGAPSLITRITNDVQQVQMLVVMACTMAIARADHDGRRRGHGAAPGRRPVGRSCSSRMPVAAVVLGLHRRRGWCRRSG